MHGLIVLVMLSLRKQAASTAVVERDQEGDQRILSAATVLKTSSSCCLADFLPGGTGTDCHLTNEIDSCCCCSQACSLHIYTAADANQTADQSYFQFTSISSSL